MRGYLLDTQAIIWLLSEPDKLSNKAKQIIQNPNNPLYYSLLSMNEIAIKASIGKLIIDDNGQDIFEKLLAQKNIVKLDMTWDTIKILQNLPFYHKDPFDRMLISHAIANDLAFISSDGHCASYDLMVVW